MANNINPPNINPKIPVFGKNAAKQPVQQECECGCAETCAKQSADLNMLPGANYRPYTSFKGSVNVDLAKDVAEFQKNPELCETTLAFEGALLEKGKSFEEASMMADSFHKHFSN